MTERIGYVHCFRLSDFRPTLKADQALLFVELMQKKVPKMDALRFVQRRHCHYDITKTKTGPSNHRIMNTHSDPHPVGLKGWTIERPVITNNKTILEFEKLKKEDDWIAKLASPTLKQISSQNQENTEKQAKIQKFYQDMDTKFKLRDLSPTEKFFKLRSIKKSNNFKVDAIIGERKTSMKPVASHRDKIQAQNVPSRHLSKELGEVRISVQDLNNRFFKHCQSVKGLPNFKLPFKGGATKTQDSNKTALVRIKLAGDTVAKNHKTMMKLERPLFFKSPSHDSRKMTSFSLKDLNGPFE
jgi:hypothetical protein